MSGSELLGSFVQQYLLHCTMQWWANIIKLTQTNIQIYSDAVLCTKQISEYIWMPHIYRTNIQIYLYLENGTNTNTNNIQGPFFRIFKYLYSSLIVVTLEKDLCYPLNIFLLRKWHEQDQGDHCRSPGFWF